MIHQLFVAFDRTDELASLAERHTMKIAASKRSLTIIGLLWSSLPTAAIADVTCPFTVSSLLVTPEGWVSAWLTTPNYSKGWWFCPVGGSTTVNDGYGQKTIASDACKVIYTQMLSAKAIGRPVTLQFHGPSDCLAASLPAEGAQPSLFPASIGIAD